MKLQGTRQEYRTPSIPLTTLPPIEEAPDPSDPPNPPDSVYQKTDQSKQFNPQEFTNDRGKATSQDSWLISTRPSSDVGSKGPDSYGQTARQGMSVVPRQSFSAEETLPSNTEPPLKPFTVQTKPVDHNPGMSKETASTIPTEVIPSMPKEKPGGLNVALGRPPPEKHPPLRDGQQDAGGTRTATLNRRCT